ncbi:MAG: hypothetical protein ABJB55_05185 [Actinomycetota bacterium]
MWKEQTGVEPQFFESYTGSTTQAQNVVNGLGETLVAHVPKEDLHGAGEATKSGWICATPSPLFAPEHEAAVDEVVP